MAETMHLPRVTVIQLDVDNDTVVRIATLLRGIFDRDLPGGPRLALPPTYPNGVPARCELFPRDWTYYLVRGPGSPIPELDSPIGPEPLVSRDAVEEWTRLAGPAPEP